MAFAWFLSLVQLGEAQNGTQDSTRWRIGLSIQFGMMTWRDQESLGHWQAPLYLVAFYNDRHQYEGDAREGSQAYLMYGLLLQSRRVEQLEIQLGYKDFRFQDSGGDQYFPATIYSNYRLARIEYTRTTAAKDRRLKPSFGVRYGGAVFLRSGVSTSRYHYPQGTSGFRQYLVGRGNVLLLQPTVWCGYRSARVLFGVQLHWNVLAHAWGELGREEYWREGLEEVFVDRTDRFSDWLAVDALVSHGLLLNEVTLKLAYNFFPFPKDLIPPEHHSRKITRAISP